MPEALAAAAPWHVRHRFLLGFALLSLLMGTSIGLAKVTTSLYALALGARGGWLGAIAAAQSVGILLTALPIGLWAERLGPARLFVAGSLAGGALYLALPAVPDPAYLLVLTALTGVSCRPGSSRCRWCSWPCCSRSAPPTRAGSARPTCRACS